MLLTIKECQKFQHQKGLSVNVAKCGSLRVLPVKGKKSMKVLTRPHRCWNDLPIPSLDFNKLQKYLGTHIHHDGKIWLPRTTWKIKLDRLKACLLNPIQKVQVITQTICSTILFQLRLSEHGLEEARKLNSLTQGGVKKILHLPTWTSSNVIHHRHGANILDLLVTTMTSRKRASLKNETVTRPSFTTYWRATRSNEWGANAKIKD